MEDSSTPATLVQQTGLFHVEAIVPTLIILVLISYVGI